MSRMTKKKPVKCVMCGATFATSEEYITHAGLHVRKIPVKRGDDPSFDKKMDELSAKKKANFVRGSEKEMVEDIANMVGLNAAAMGGPVGQRGKLRKQTPEEFAAEVKANLEADEKFRQDVLARAKERGINLNPLTTMGYQFGWARNAGDSLDKVVDELLVFDRAFSGNPNPEKITVITQCKCGQKNRRDPVRPARCGRCKEAI